MTKYESIDVEKDPNTKLPVANYSYNWPSHGEIEFKNYYVKYRPTLPYVLKDVSLRIGGGEKVERSRRKLSITVNRLVL